jgi:hypothetical protein
MVLEITVHHSWGMVIFQEITLQLLQVLLGPIFLTIFTQRLWSMIQGLSLIQGTLCVGDLGKVNKSEQKPGKSAF